GRRFPGACTPGKRNRYGCADGVARLGAAVPPLAQHRVARRIALLAKTRLGAYGVIALLPLTTRALARLPSQQDRLLPGESRISPLQPWRDADTVACNSRHADSPVALTWLPESLCAHTSHCVRNVEACGARARRQRAATHLGP